MRTSSIPAGAIVEGSIRGAGDLVVRGTVEGPITLDGTLTIDVAGLVRGDVRARAIVVRGTLEGPAHASEVVRLEAGARLYGDVFAERISAASGALVRGRVRMAGADRLRRTVGGTIEAPFSSAGAIEAPGHAPAHAHVPSPSIRNYLTTPASSPSPAIRTQLTAPAPPLDGAHAFDHGGAHVEPVAREPAVTLAPEPDHEPGPRVRRQTERSGPLPAEAPASASPASASPASASPASASLASASPASASQARAAVPRHATPPPPREARALDDTRPERRDARRSSGAGGPPAPVVPAIGRVRVRRREEAGS